MKITVTKSQAYMILEALEWAQNPDFPDYDPLNAKYIRIENRIRKALGEEEYVPLNAKQEKRIKELVRDYSIPIEERIKKIENIRNEEL